MADSLKEIYLASVTLSDVAGTGETTLFTTDAATQYVVKDVYVDGTLDGSTFPVLTVNNVAAVSLLTSAGGSEIIDVSSTVKYKAFAAAPVLETKSVTGFTTANSYVSNVSSTVNGIEAVSSVSDNTVTSVTSSTITKPMEFLEASNGDVFYIEWDGNSTSALYKRTGGPNGTQTQIFSNSYGWAVSNGVDAYFYCTNGSNVVSRYDINTGAVTTKSYPESLASSSYPSAYYMNSGHILINKTGNSDNSRLLIINSASTIRVVVSLSPLTLSGGTYRISGVLDATTGYYTLYRRMNSVLNKIQLSSTLNTTSGTFAGTKIETNDAIVSVSSETYITQTSNTYSFANHGSNSGTTLSTLNLLTGVTTTEDFLPYRTNSHGFSISTTSAAANIFTVSVPVRITGIKTTI
jgi:hypothetical protein